MGIINAKWNSASQVETLNEALKNAEDVRDEAIRHGVLHLETIAKLEEEIARLLREMATQREKLDKAREIIRRAGLTVFP